MSLLSSDVAMFEDRPSQHVEILVVEDNPGDALLTCEALTDSAPDALSVRHCSRLGEAIDSIRRRQPRCVVLDLDLPDASGLDGLARLRLEFPRLPIVVLTGHGEAPLGIAAINEGATDYLVKGSASDELLRRTVRHAIERHRMAVALAESQRRVRAMFDRAPVGQVIIGLDGRLLEINAAAATMMGVQPADAAGIHVDDVIADAVDPWPIRRAGLIAEGTVGPIDRRLLTSEGTAVDTRITTTVVCDAQGAPTEIIALIEDITTLRAAEADYRRIVESTHDGVWSVDEQGVTTGVNEQMATMLGYRVAELLGKPAAPLYLDGAAFADRLAERLRGRSSQAWTKLRHRDGSLVTVQLSGRPLYDHHGLPCGAVAVIADRTEQQRAQEALRASEARFRAIVANLSDVVTVHDASGRPTWTSPSLSAALLSDDVQLIDVIHPDDVALVTTAIRSWVEAGSDGAVEFRVRGADDRWRELEGRAVNLLEDPDVQGIVLTSRDVTERRRAERELEVRALHDPLTGLPNRTLFNDRLRQCLDRDRRRGSRTAALYVDIDRFKTVNDSLGHEAGDEVLRAVGELLESAVRPGDTVARFGGDEFVICCENVDSERDAEALAARILQRLRTPFRTAGLEFEVCVSVGVALASPTSRQEPELLLRTADGAMYEAKAAGGDAFRVSVANRQPHGDDRLAEEQRLRRAVEHGDIEVHLQPEIDLETGRTVGFEALARWRDPVRGIVHPASFIPLAEATGLIVPLGRSVLEQACRHQRAIADATATQLWMSVNLSARQLAAPTIVRDVQEVLAATGVDPESVWLEITETALMADVDAATRRLCELRSLGLRIAIDDFGTGWSSLLYLRRFPVQLLKIDRSFVSGLGVEREDSTIVDAVVGLAQALGIQSIAEGVEREVQRAELVGLGCDFAQGFLFADAMPVDAAIAWLQRD